MEYDLAGAGALILYVVGSETAFGVCAYSDVIFKSITEQSAVSSLHLHCAGVHLHCAVVHQPAASVVHVVHVVHCSTVVDESAACVIEMQPHEPSIAAIIYCSDAVLPFDPYPAIIANSTPYSR